MNSNSVSQGPNRSSVAELLVKLVAVGLKEASMDSPTFRASMNHTHLAIIGTVNSLNQLLNLYQTSRRISSMIFELQHDSLETMSPLIDGPNSFINKDTTLPHLQLTFYAVSIVLSNLVKMMDLDEEHMSGIETILQVDIPQYFQLRKNFDTIQSKYDLILAKYLQLPLKNPSVKTREDALQLFEIRKQYIHTSMEIWTSVQKLQSKVSFVLTNSTKSFWEPFNKNFNIKDDITGMPNLADIWEISSVIKEIEQLNLASIIRNQSNESLSIVLNDFKVSSEDTITQLFTPSNDLSTYVTSLINDNDLKIDDLNILKEKHGWVFIKSNKLDGSRGKVWIKRWMFIKDDIFGFLAISQNGQFVEESDKIGILLVNVAQSVNEDRKFCIEITGSINITIQLETFNELKSWLLMFKYTQNWSRVNNTPFGKGRYESNLDSMKIKPVVSKDSELVLNTPVDKTIERMKELMEQKMASLSYHLNINPPMETRATVYSVLSNMYMTSMTTPSSTRSNFWGYVNWGIRNSSSPHSNKSLQILDKNEPRSLIDLRYPDYYPEYLRLIDIEMRSIFEYYIPRDKFALLNFNGSWSPNSQQTLFCNVYVNSDSFYCYTNNCGLISILPLKLSNLLYCEVVDKNSYKILRIFFVNGISIKIKIFQGNADSIRDQLYFIIKNRNTLETKSVIEELLRIQNFYERKEENSPLEHFKEVNSKILDPNRKLNILTIKKDPIHEENDDFNEFHQQSTGNMKKIWSKKYELPAKALFHVLFGDESFLLHCTLPLASSIFTDSETRQSLWRCDSNQILTRVVWNSVFKLPCSKQTIGKMINNKFYSVDQETPHLKLVLGISRKISMRFIINSMDSKSCKVSVYYSMNSATTPFNWFNSMVMQQLMLFRMEALDEKLKGVVSDFQKKKRKIAYAIKKFGLITKYDSDEPTNDELSFLNSVSFIPLQLFSIFYFEKINFQVGKLIHSMIKGIVSTISKCIKFINLNLVILSILGCSLILNLILGGITSHSYWRERNVMKSVSTFQNKNIMERSLSLKEIDDFIKVDKNVSRVGGECYSNFIEETRYGIIDDSIMGLRLERNELVTKLNLLNNIEKSSIWDKWFAYVNEEYYKCKKVEIDLPQEFSRCKEYCEEVGIEFNNLI